MARLQTSITGNSLQFAPERCNLLFATFSSFLDRGKYWWKHHLLQKCMIQQKTNSLCMEIVLIGLALDHFCECSDTFNENTPPTSEPEYISSLGAAVYKAMSKGNKNAVWLMQVCPLFHFYFHWHAYFGMLSKNCKTTHFYYINIGVRQSRILHIIPWSS